MNFQEFVQSTNGQYFTVVFRKRSDGSLRTMNCRTGVKKHLSGGEKKFSDKDKNLVTVYDQQSGVYRSIPIEGVKYVIYKKKKINFTQNS